MRHAGAETRWSKKLPSWYKQLPLGFGIICEMQTPFGPSFGEVHFDLEKFPDLPDDSQVSTLAEQLGSTSVSTQPPSRRKSSLSGFARRLMGSTKDGSPAGPSETSSSKIHAAPSTETYPLYGLFLDSSVCLVLVPKSPAAQGAYPRDRSTPGSFERVGIGNFLRTKSQIGEPDVTNFDAGSSIPFGPITADMPRREVVIC